MGSLLKRAFVFKYVYLTGIPFNSSFLFKDIPCFPLNNSQDRRADLGGVDDPPPTRH